MIKMALELELVGIESVPPSRIHQDVDGTIWIEDDLNDRRIIRAEDNFAAPLTKKYRLKDGVTREEAAKLLTDALKRIGVEVRVTRGHFIALESDGTLTVL